VPVQTTPSPATLLQLQSLSGPTEYSRFIAGAEKQPGLFTLWRKDGRVYLELRDDQFDKDFIMHVQPANGLGGFGVYPGQAYFQDARLVRFTRDGRRIAMIWPQTRLVADPETPLADAVRLSTADSIAGLLSPAAEDKSRHVTIVDLSLLLGDILNLGEALSDSGGGGGLSLLSITTSYRLDPSRTYFGPSKSFEDNATIEVEQGFTSSRSGDINTVPDDRSILMRVVYNFAALPPATGYMPRFADDRVGFWEDPHVQFAHDNEPDQILHYMLRWDMRQTQRFARMSPALHPIVYTLSNTIPLEYREPIRAGILEWNKAFERIGISGAIEVQDQPSTGSFDPDDIRYNMVTWVTSASPDFGAEAQVIWDPRDGRIFRSGILIDASIARVYKLQHAIRSIPGVLNAGDEDAIPMLPANAANPHPLRYSESSFALGMADQAQYGAVVMQATGFGGRIPKTYVYDFLKAIAMHETGHTFGLSHNFIGHNAYSQSELRDAAFTARYGIVSTVMEYEPINLWPAGESRGTLFQRTIGPYDYYAIAWGYRDIANAASPRDEVPVLNAWAADSNNPRHAFRGDEDAFWNGHATDPRVQPFMLSNDQIGWCTSQLGLTESAIGALDRNFPGTGQPWQNEQTALISLIGQYFRCSASMSFYVAAEYSSRARIGDVNAGLPLTPVPRSVERRAFVTLSRYVFSDSAFHFSPQLLRRAVYTERAPLSSDIGYEPTVRHDIPVSLVAAIVQNRAISYMFSPTVLGRLADMPTKARPGEAMTVSDLFEWMQDAVYGDLKAGRPGTTQAHRNLQRRYARYLRSLSNVALPIPYDAQAMARYELVDLNSTLNRLVRSKAFDLQTRAHLEAMQVDVQRGVDAKAVTPG
jgi:hypothetical protein